MGTNTAYRSVFEKIFSECEVLFPEPEAATPKDGAAPLAGGDIVEDMLIPTGGEIFAGCADRMFEDICKR